ncbi:MULTISPECIES: energy-dependent translational throttle protein EttA [unclassified Pseudodesulfovibrio]|uniref:energy-dependent translational throttle protein EttA n=1 Tax=unclassified Pseudodesulfovibrio TaxID=2661612 RepID=UPI000FEB97BA|nr:MULTISPECIES: energy-dependent translational throttle protein EttA [unclassified Pseudodesulfovibrio]MCJ2163938.1 energy-dependent translational throttle protein EttA [Pseudodesulfovibrio sp. S3-i]RWU05817.1 energy-dependent translational throttle protein EttA [Pseudodesulfovibrio sp. S3]
MSNESEKIIYSMYKVTKRHGQREVLKNISLSYFYGAKIGVLGLNGSGKSSLLRILAGEDTTFEGEIHVKDGYTIGYLEQEPLVNDERTVREVVEEGVGEIMDIINEYNAINEKFAEPMEADEMDALIEKQGKVQELMDSKGAWDIDSKLEMAMDSLRCPPGDTPVSVISGGERRRVALCRLLLQSPDILLLDEPTNHLDADSVAWLEQFLGSFPGTVIAVTHDRYFLDNVAGWILELDRGRGIPWKGNYSSWLDQKQNRLAQEGKQEEERQKTLQRELEWIRMSPKGRRAKSKARINAYESMVSHESARLADDLQIYIPPGPHLGKQVIVAEGVSKAMGDKLLMENVDFIIPPNAIVGIIGPNGAGKSTLCKMIVGEEKPDAGTLTLGSTVEFAYADQNRGSLTPGKTVYEIISGGAEFIKLGDREINARAYCSRFNFAGQDQQKKVDVLSGGERNRVHMAQMLKSGANVLLLDEPTNDLDVNTMRALEDGLENFAGCVLVISHDRWFLDRVATHIIAFEGDSKVVMVEGNYSDYDVDRKKRLGSEADRPHRLKFRKLTR